MIAGIFFILLIFIGLFALIASIILLIIGLARKSKRLKTVGLSLLTIPLFCWGLFYLYYGVIIPEHDRQQEIEYSGTYITDQSGSYNKNKRPFRGKKYRLILNEDKTFELDKTPYIDFHGKGTWEAGDEYFHFINNNGEIIERVSPFESNGKKKIIFHLYDEIKEVRFIKE
ncbi:MAG: hypothetical protein GY754_29140 [bacterium]|nr:hypothetical protein [bacterium]